jgi:two-component system response regulator
MAAGGGAGGRADEMTARGGDEVRLSSGERPARGRTPTARPAVPTLLFADSSADYRAMARDALLEGSGPADLRFATDGADLMDYVHRRGRHEDPVTTPTPALIVLDLDLPESGLDPSQPSGLDAVKAIRADPELRRIPVIALTSRADRETVAAAYDAGVNTFIAKPVTFLALVKLMKTFTAYWLEAAELP